MHDFKSKEWNHKNMGIYVGEMFSKFGEGLFNMTKLRIYKRYINNLDWIKIKMPIWSKYPKQSKQMVDKMRKKFVSHTRQVS